MTQLFYDNSDYYRFRDNCESAGIEIPIIPGILPVTNFKQAKRIANMCKAAIPSTLAAAMTETDDPGRSIPNRRRPRKIADPRSDHSASTRHPLLRLEQERCGSRCARRHAGSELDLAHRYPSNQVSATRCQQPGVSNQVSATRCQQPGVSNQVSAIRCQQSAGNSSLILLPVRPRRT